MKKILFIILGLVAAAATMLFANRNENASETITDKTGFTYTAEDVKRGDYLVTVLVCDDCHSPKVMGPAGPEIDMSRRLSGRPADMPFPEVDTSTLKKWALFSPDGTAAVGPWGASFSANLTSDVTGTGNWTFEQFKTALRKGKYKGLENGRDLLPLMPWQQYRHLTDKDMHDIFAYLRSTKPVNNIVPAPIPPHKLVN